MAQKCNKKLQGKKVPPLSPLTFQRAAGPLEQCECGNLKNSSPRSLRRLKFKMKMKVVLSLLPFNYQFGKVQNL